MLAHRSPDAPQHPLNRLGQERYLRWQLEQDPALVGMVEVVAAEPPQPRPNLKDPIPCVARAVAADGSVSTLVCSVGVDLDLVGFVADVQETVGRPGGRRAAELATRCRSPTSVLGLLSTPSRHPPRRVTRHAGRRARGQ